jgi:HEAT repeat protein
MVCLPFSKEGFRVPAMSFIAVCLLHLPAYAQSAIPTGTTKWSCSDSPSLNQGVWSDNGIERRQALKVLGGCGPEHWKLKVLMVPILDMDTRFRSQSWINLYSGLDPQAIAKPERITQFLLARAESTDSEDRRLAIQALGDLLRTRFGDTSFTMSQPALLRGLSDTDARVRQAATNGFIYYGHSERSSQLAKLLGPVVSALASGTTDPVPEVRAASVESIASLSETDKFGARLRPLLSTSELLKLVKPRLADPSTHVRLKAVEALLERNRTEQVTPAQQEQIQQWILSLTDDQDAEVVIAAVGGLDKARVAELITRIQSEHFPLPMIAALPSLSVADNPAWQNLMQHLLASSDLSVRINAQRAVLNLIRGQGSSLEQIAKSQILFAQGLRASDPVKQLDAIAGLSALGPSVDTVALLRPSLSSPLAPVRWAAAIAISKLDPKGKAAYPILREILEAVSPNDNRDSANLRETAMVALQNSNTSEGAKIIAEAAGKESRLLYYIRDCNTYGLSFSRNHALVAVNTMKLLPCRRALAEGFSSENSTPEGIQGLIRLSRTEDPDLRFNAVYALGFMAYRFSEAKPQKGDQIAEVFLSIANDDSEHLDVRRIAATMLHIHGYPMRNFFTTAGLLSPDSLCSYPHMGRGREPGFKFDPYEGRCLYDTRTGCGAGLGEVYSTLRRMLGQSNNR